ncbi:membrane protein insertase YidC [bacterium]|nr:membrane protein insertase YidC [bacterium]
MDKRTILAFVFIGLIVILLPYYYNLINPPKENLVDTETGIVSEDRAYNIDTSYTKRVREQQYPSSESSTVDESEKIPFTTTDGKWQKSDTDGARIIKIETPYYIASVSAAGGKFISFKLKEFSDRRGGMVEMIGRGDSDLHYPNAYFTFSNIGLSTHELIFQPSGGNLNVNPGRTAELVLTAELLNGGKIVKRYGFSGDNYRIDFDIETYGVPDISDYYVRWDGAVNITEPDTAQDLSYSKAYAKMGGEIVTFDAPKKGDRDISSSGKTDWIALRSKYFEIAMVPQSSTEGINFRARRLNASATGLKEFELAMKMHSSRRDLKENFILYLGPIDSKRLSSLNVGLEATMNWGWSIIKPFSKLVLWSFKQLHAVIPNYGIVIIVFSILIKIILWPLTHKSFQSMKKMSKLQPLIKELKEKYKSDPQKMQKETMRLYKEHKVNPMGGCLPVLLQMPLLYSLFIVFRSTIELREANFAFWINDLSLPDTIINLPFALPLYGNHVTVLPILMGISTFFQSKMTITDPNQKMMLYFMPIFLTLMFNNFPAGLTLYYTLFNLLSMVHQRIISVKDDGAPAAAGITTQKKSVLGRKK